MADEAVKNPPSHEDIFRKMNGYEKPAVAEPVPVGDALKPTEEEKEKPVAAPVPAEVPTANAEEELSDEAFLKVYEKKTGKKAKSLDDLKEPPKPPTAQELADAAEKEKTESLEWAWENKKISKELYDKSVIDRAKDKRSIALAIFTAELQEGDKKITTEEAEEMFKDYYSEEEEEGSWKRTKALKEMNTVADKYLSQYDIIDKLPEEYQKVKTNAERQKAYTKQVNLLKKEIPSKLTFSYPTGEEADGKPVTFDYEIEVDDKVTEQIAKELIGNGNPNVWDADPKVLKQEMEYHVFARNRDKVISELLSQHGKKIATEVEARLKNAIAPQQAFSPQQDGGNKTPPDHSAVLNRVK